MVGLGVGCQRATIIPVHWPRGGKRLGKKKKKMEQNKSVDQLVVPSNDDELILVVPDHHHHHHHHHHHRDVGSYYLRSFVIAIPSQSPFFVVGFSSGHSHAERPTDLLCASRDVFSGDKDKNETQRSRSTRAFLGFIINIIIMIIIILLLLVFLRSGTTTSTIILCRTIMRAST
jgi:hypothetical protein